MVNKTISCYCPFNSGTSQGRQPKPMALIQVEGPSAHLRFCQAVQVDRIYKDFAQLRCQWSLGEGVCLSVRGGMS